MQSMDAMGNVTKALESRPRAAAGERADVDRRSTDRAGDVTWTASCISAGPVAGCPCGHLAVTGACSRLCCVGTSRSSCPRGGMEWFTRDREPPAEPAVLAVTHGGPRAGRSDGGRRRWAWMRCCSSMSRRSAPVCWICSTGIASCPLAGFPRHQVRHSTGVQWRNLSVRELAVCAEAEFRLGASAAVRRMSSGLAGVNPVCGHAAEGGEAFSFRTRG